MCGIVGYVGSKPLLPVLMEGLRRLEYRGYDSAGVAVVRNGEMFIRRSAGKLSNLDVVLEKDPIEGQFGIGHTRWATHGRPTEENAHPHRDCRGRIVVVHNGIIENYLELKRELTAEGHKFVTETDTEIVAHLRPASVVGEGAHIGNFVELKKTSLGRGSKANHLAYVGDTSVGSDVNIGAGTITCNYDGAHKHRTVIEDGVHIGSDVQLVAPVTVAKGATVGAGTTVWQDTPPGGLVINVKSQQHRADWRRPSKNSVKGGS